jgi:hypothetical protein
MPVDPGEHTDGETSTHPAQGRRLMPDTELIDYFCVENEKSVQHFRP